ncbi:hypothetical protein Tco_1437402, partial [Tanacetum coccineum]
MTNKHSIMTREMVESFCNSYYIPDEVHPTAPGQDKTITQFPEGKVGVYTRVFPISVPLYTGGVLEKDPAPHLTARQEQAVQTWFALTISRLADLPKDAPAAVHQASGRRLPGAGSLKFLSAPSARDNVALRRGCLSRGKHPEKGQEEKLSKQSYPLPAKRYEDRTYLAHARDRRRTLASLRRTIPEGSLLLGSYPANVHTQVTVRSSRVVDAPVYTAADTVTSSRGKTLVVPTSDVGGSSQPETSEESADSFYETAVLNSKDAKHWEKDAEIARLKSLVKEKETESAEVLRLRDQKDTDISLLDSRASYLKSALDDSQAACDEARNLISSLSSERDGLASEVSTLHYAFRDFKEKMEAQQEAQAQVLYNRVAELEAHVMDVSGRLEGEFYPAYLTALAGQRWLLTHKMELAMVKCLKSPEYQGILGHALGQAVDYGMQEGLAAGHEHGVARTPLSAVMAYNLEIAEAHYLDVVRALEEA